MGICQVGIAAVKDIIGKLVLDDLSIVHDLACAALSVTAGQLRDVTLCLNCNSRYHITFAGAQVPVHPGSDCSTGRRLLIPHQYSYLPWTPLSFGGTEMSRRAPCLYHDRCRRVTPFFRPPHGIGILYRIHEGLWILDPRKQ